MNVSVYPQFMSMFDTVYLRHQVHNAWGGATWFQLYPDVCVEKGRTWVPFRPQVSEMSDMISLNMGVNFATSLNMGGRLSQNCIS